RRSDVRVPRKEHQRQGADEPAKPAQDALQLLCSSSPLVNVQVRVMLRTSVSRRTSAGKAENGAAICTILTAAASSTRWPDDFMTSTFSSEPSFRIETLSCRLPYSFICRAASG